MDSLQNGLCTCISHQTFDFFFHILMHNVKLYFKTLKSFALSSSFIYILAKIWCCESSCTVLIRPLEQKLTTYNIPVDVINVQHKSKRINYCITMLFFRLKSQPLPTSIHLTICVKCIYCKPEIHLLFHK